MAEPDLQVEPQCPSADTADEAPEELIVFSPDVVKRRIQPGSLLMEFPIEFDDISEEDEEDDPMSVMLPWCLNAEEEAIMSSQFNFSDLIGADESCDEAEWMMEAAWSRGQSDFEIEEEEV